MMFASIQILILFTLQFLSCAISSEERRRPNLIIVMTDEQNYRTLGCYRDRLEESQKFIWGEGVKVETPHLDSLAQDGAMYTNFFASSPLCTPARASFVTGLYPNATGAASNGDSLSDDAVTFARILQLNGYRTAYIGKWHLNGRKKPGWMKKSENNFGFKYNKYLFNRGHWKFFEDKEDGSVRVRGWTRSSSKKYRGRLSKHYATDFLTNRAIKYMRKTKNSKKPFALMLSLPDPHNPTNVRQPYDTMYNNMTFQVPHTAVNALKAQPGLPLWSNLNISPKTMGVRIKKIKPYEADFRIQQLIDSEARQKTLRETFGMIKLIDDNVGKILNYVRKARLDNNTIVVFTSDHGDMMGEHLRHNKLVPYDTSAGVPFLIRYPGHITPGKVVETAHSGTDFAPTILSVMDASLVHKDIAVDFHGLDGSAELLNDVGIVNDKNQVSFMTSAGKNKPWAAAFTSQYKLVLSGTDVPWFYNRTSDPDEITNIYDDTSTIIRELKDHLKRAMTQYNMPLANSRAFFWDMPSCRDSPNSFSAGKKDELRICSSVPKNECKWSVNKDTCPLFCGICATDSEGKLWIDGNLTTCDQLPVPVEESCKLPESEQFCALTCRDKDKLQPTSSPTSLSSIVTLMPSVGPFATPSYAPSHYLTQTPSIEPSSDPSEPLIRNPSANPSRLTLDAPSEFSSEIPSSPPSLAPRGEPSDDPSESPSHTPSGTRSRLPLYVPSGFPSVITSVTPSLAPRIEPSEDPSDTPSDAPSATHSRLPSDSLSYALSATHSRFPSYAPSDFPFEITSRTPSMAPRGEPSADPS